MKKNLALVLTTLVCAFALTGCAFVEGLLNNGAPNVVDPAKADMVRYEQIGVPFKAYYTNDTTLSEDVEASYNAAVAEWQDTGSTWDIYGTIAPAYVDYLVADDSLGRDSVSIRRDTVLSWQLFLTSTTGETPEDVFNPVEP
jgi:hypothetical protein